MSHDPGRDNLQAIFKSWYKRMQEMKAQGIVLPSKRELLEKIEETKKKKEVENAPEKPKVKRKYRSIDDEWES